MKNFTVKALIILLIFTGFTFLNRFHSSRNLRGPLFPDAAESIGSEDDPQARMNWELRRLADPETGQLPPNYRIRELQFAKTLEQEINPFGKATSNLTWVHRGPYHLGGRTRAVAMDVTNENILIAGSVSGGMWRSTDGGTTWTKTSKSSPGATSVVQDTRPGKTNIWYYSSGEPYGTSAGATGAFFLGNGIYKSIDGGITWDSIAATYTGTPQSWDKPYDITWNMALNAKDLVNDVIYVAACGGIFKSIDGGSNWTTEKGTFSGGGGSYFTDILSTSDSGIVYAALSTYNTGGGNGATNSGIWRYSGTTWTNISPVFFPDSCNRIKIGINPSDQREVYFLAVTPDSGQATTDYRGNVEHSSLWKYTYVSGDGSGAGGIWENRSSNIPANIGPFDNFYAQGGYDVVIKVKPDNPNVIFIGGTNIFRSTDAFTSTTNTTKMGGYGIGTTYPDFNPYPNHHSDQHDFIFLPSNPNVMINAADGGLYKTTDCMSSNVVWSSLNVSYITSQFYTCAVDHGTPNSNILIAGAQDNGSWWENSVSPTNTWTFSAKGDGSYCAIADGAGTYYYSRQLGEMIKCTLDANGVQTAFKRIDPIGASGYDFINPFIIDPNNNNLMYLPAGTKMWRNNDLSAIGLTNTYDSISTNWMTFPDTVTAGTISAVAVSKNPANRLYYGTSNRRVYRVDNANVGNPTAVDITKTTNPNAFPSSGTNGVTSNVNCIAIDPNDADRAIVVFSNYGLQSLYYTINAGSYWQKIGGTLEPAGSVGPSCRWASILPVNGGNVYLVATSTGLYGTTYLDSSNTTWVPLAQNEIGNTVCDMIETRISDGLVVVVTHGSGIYSTNITDVSQVGMEGIHFTKSTLSIQNFPNPFTQSSHIYFSLGKPCSGYLKIYNSAGKEIKSFENNSFSSGDHHFDFEGKNLPAGVYYCVLKAGSLSETKKLVLVK